MWSCVAAIGVRFSVRSFGCALFTFYPTTLQKRGKTMKKISLHKVLRKLSALAFTALLIATINIAFAENGSISFAESEYSIPVGWNGKTITPTTHDINNWLKYEFYSENTAIAVVENSGYVRGVSGGTTVIHCKGTNPTTNEEYEASYTITVTIPVTSLSVEQTSISLGVTEIAKEDMPSEIVDSFYHTPKVTFNPENASNQTLQWSSSNEQVATVDKNGVIKAVHPGWAVITGKVTDGGWASVQINVSVPKTFVSATNIRVTSKEPVLFGCVAQSGSGQRIGTSVTPSGVRYINERWQFGTTGDCFTLASAKELNNNEKTDDFDTDAKLSWYYIVPTKAGQGTIQYVVNGTTVFSVSVVIDKTAVE